MIILFQILSFLLWVAVVIKWIYNTENNFSNFHFQFFPSYFKEVNILPWSKIYLWREGKEKCSGGFFLVFLDTGTSFLFYMFFNWEKKGWELDRVYLSLPWARSFPQFRNNAKGLDSISFERRQLTVPKWSKVAKNNLWKSCSLSMWKHEQMAILFADVESSQQSSFTSVWYSPSYWSEVPKMLQHIQAREVGGGSQYN